jgi:hypothetical protein
MIHFKVLLKANFNVLDNVCYVKKIHEKTQEDCLQFEWKRA